METIRPARPQRNGFDLSHSRKLSMNMGDLVPIMCEEVMPGDYFKDTTNVVLRMSPMLAPIMHNIDVFTHFFFVPNRLIWDDWEKFITGGSDGLDASVWPNRVFTSVEAGSLADHLGLPLTSEALPATSMLPFRASQLIWNQWFRDQWLQSELTISKASGTDSTTNVTLQKRAWEKDYFTSALPSPQRGAAVTLPLGTSAPVKTSSTALVTGAQQPLKLLGASAGGALNDRHLGTNSGAMGSDTVAFTNNEAVYPSNLYADLQSATSATINAIRQAARVQEFLERNARGGARYVENILAHFGIRSSDARLQRPEFLGGGRSPVVVSEVLQTSETSANSPLAQMGGHGFSVQSHHHFAKEFEEHGLIIGFLSVLPRTAYQQGIPRKFSRSTKYDYPWPIFAQLGEQAILNKELYCSVGDGLNEGIFGYQGRYDEFRRRESSVHGEFRISKDNSGLDFWHMGRIFESRPTLSSAFVTADPTTRNFAIEGQDTCLVQVFNNLKAVRPLPLVNEPRL